MLLKAYYVLKDDKIMNRLHRYNRTLTIYVLIRKRHCVMSAKLYDSCYYKYIVTKLIIVKVNIINVKMK